MARSNAASAAVTGEMSAEEQAMLDEDRTATLPVEETPQQAADEGVSQDDTGAVEGADGDEQTPAAAGAPKMVRLEALHEERALTKRLNQELAEAKRARETLEERTNLLLQRLGPALQPRAPDAAQAPAIPTLEADPVGHILGRQAQAEALLGQIVQAVVGQDQQSQAANSAASLRMRAEALEREFATASPDYPQAAEHLLNARRAELQAAGWTDPAEIQQMMAAEAQGLAIRAIQQGQNPAEVVYRLAKLRGFNGATSAAAAAPAEAAAQPATADAQNGAARLGTIERGQQQARSIGQVRGQGPAPMTVQQFLALDGDEYLKMLKTVEGKNFMGV